MATDRRIVSTAPIDPIVGEILSPKASLQIAPAPDEATMLGLLDGTVGLIARGEGKVTAPMIAACPNLAVIGRPGAGFDTVDVAAATARKIPVVFAPVGGFAVAEGALAMLLALVKRLAWCDQVVKSGQWQRRYEAESGDMTEHTLGIVGLGRIGRHLARLAQPFDMSVLAFDPYVRPDEAAAVGVQLTPLDELLSRCDYLSLHVLLDDTTRGLIDRKAVAAMKGQTLLVNTSRGGVIESLDVLADGLESGQLGGVGLDVFPTEPPDVTHRLFKDPRVLAAPHLVGVSRIAMGRICRSMATDMLAVLEGRKVKFCVNPEVLNEES